ncbi:MAG: response regulator [Nitrospinae bacterium]|nr:response regulator [Nitrospinota bacterium]
MLSLIKKLLTTPLWLAIILICTFVPRGLSALPSNNSPIEVDFSQGFTQLAPDSFETPQPETWDLFPLSEFKKAFAFKKFSDFWIGFTINNKSRNPEHQIVALTTIFDLHQLELWQFKNGVWELVEKQDHQQWNYLPRESHVPYFKIDVAPGTTRFFVKIRSIGNGMGNPITVWEPGAFREHIAIDQTIVAFILGIMVIMAFYNLALFVSLKDKAYLYFAGYILSCSCFIPIRDGYFSAWFGINLNLINQDRFVLVLMLGVIWIMILRYIYSFLQLDRSKGVLRFLWWFNHLLILIPQPLLLISWTYNPLLLFCQFIISLLLMGLLIYQAFLASSRQGQARWLIFSIGFSWIGEVTELARLDGNVSEIFRHSLLTGLLIEVVVLSFYMVFRVNRLRQEKDDAHTRMFDESVKHAAELEQKVADRTKELQTANTTKDRFFSIISHDLRGPMGSLSVIFNDILESPKDFSEEMFQITRQTTKNTNVMLNDLLDWARSQSGHMQPESVHFDLNDSIKNTVDFLKPQGNQKMIEIVVDVSEELCCFADKAMIATVIRNLLSNAIKYTPEGGKITIGSSLKGENLHVYIQDTGKGITPELEAKLFNVGEKVSSSPGTANETGSGLGLILCKEFIEKNGGSIGVDSKPDQGSTFWFTLPRGEKKPPISENMDIGLQSLRILIVEDNPLHQESSKKALEGCKELSLAMDGPTAVQKAIETKPSLILMDIDLPGFNGIVAAQRIRQEMGEKTLIIAVTSYTQQEVEELAGEQEFDGYLNKPLDKERLFKIISTSLCKRSR